ncbi:MAG: DUF2065 domain-containing protein [Burkholderiaceae bacterium]
MDSLLTAIGFVLIIEGLLPFVSPAAWRKGFMQVAQLADGQIRFIGLGAVVVGLLLLLLI